MNPSGHHPAAPPTDRSRPSIAIPDELPASIAAGGLLALGVLLGWLLPNTPALRLLAAIPVWTSLAIGMTYGGAAAVGSLRARTFDIDVLMVIAAGLAAAMGHPADAALLLVLFTLAGALEHRALCRTQRAVEALHRLMPTEALTLREGKWERADPRSLRPGDRIRIRPGDLIPADARIVRGSTAVDQSTLTGESLPREAGEGDEIYAGTLNAGNPIEAEVLRPVAHSSLQKVLDLVTTAQQQREPLQRTIDRLSQPYAIGVMVTSASVFLVWWLAIRFAPADAAYVAIALLIVASPCALVIATPTATLAGISRAARAGLLFKGGQAIERLARMGAVCLDKTGTLTRGRPTLDRILPIGDAPEPEMLALAAALESGSAHPIARAVVDEAARRGLILPTPVGLTDLPGRGLSAVVSGHEVRLGTFEHCAPLIRAHLRPPARERLERARATGALGVTLASDSGEGAILILADQIRPGARALVDRLHALGIRPVRMLTGDHPTTASHVAAELGIDQWDAELLPQDKVRLLNDLRRAHSAPARPSLGALTERAARRLATGIGVIGDGVNDAPALASADVSIAIGSIGSDAALESADIVLLNDDLTVIPWAVRLARRTRAVVLFNLILALSVIAAMGLGTLVGSLTGRLIPLSLAVFTHEGGTLLVVLNSLRLLATPKPKGITEIGQAHPLPIPVDIATSLSRS